MPKDLEKMVGELPNGHKSMKLGLETSVRQPNPNRIRETKSRPRSNKS